MGLHKYITGVNANWKKS